MKYSTALRDLARRRIERLGTSDIVVGIPCYNNDTTIAHVVETVETGLSKYYPQMRSIVVVSDGGSVDDTRDVASAVDMTPWVERLVMIYRGVPGKGSAVRAVFETAAIVNAKIVVLFDADLRSLTPEWVKKVADPVLSGEYDFVVPLFRRYKYDGTITNNIVYNLTRALYGYRIRQPMGGDFGCSQRLIKDFLQYDVWETDVGKFGIDIWLTTTAIVRKYRICQSQLGVVIHDEKDPAESLGSMFRQVVSTLFSLIEENYEVWKDVKGSLPVPIVGDPTGDEPKPFGIDVPRLVEEFRLGLQHFGPLWESILEVENYSKVEELVELTDPMSFSMDNDLWIKLVYDFASTFHQWSKDRVKMVNTITPLYYARVASFANEVRNMSDAEAEALVEAQAQRTEELKPYFLERWNSIDSKNSASAATLASTS